MKLSQNGLEFIKQWEDVRLKSYKDGGGVWTIGAGHTGPNIKARMTCTMQQAETWLYADVTFAEHAISTLVNVPLTQDQFDALVSFVFNVGTNAFRLSTMRVRLNALDYKGAATQFPRWNYDNGVIVAGLTNRRKAEQALFERQGLEIPSWTPQPPTLSPSQPQPPAPTASPSTTSLLSRLRSTFSGFFTSR